MATPSWVGLDVIYKPQELSKSVYPIFNQHTHVEQYTSQWLALVRTVAAHAVAAEVAALVPRIRAPAAPAVTTPRLKLTPLDVRVAKLMHATAPVHVPVVRRFERLTVRRLSDLSDNSCTITISGFLSLNLLLL
ncbi:hypothetical protein QCA50_005165 [Cerrena zonata]|uniref:Uncharacterized protein n=1 Tax=Cerrena zonata TaxID=2478898 RepID=A0AAW0GQC8_9APHY